MDNVNSWRDICALIWKDYTIMTCNTPTIFDSYTYCIIDWAIHMHSVEMQIYEYWIMINSNAVNDALILLMHVKHIINETGVTERCGVSVNEAMCY